MPNTDERRARAFMMEGHEFESETLDPNFEVKWKEFLKHGPHYGTPRDLAKEFKRTQKPL